MKEVNIKISRFNIFTILALVVLLMALSFLFGFYVGNGYTQFNKYKLFGEAYGILQRSYNGNLPGDTLIEHGMINGVLQVIGDPYTVLVEPPEHQLQSDQLAGKYGGIGARVEMDTQHQYRLYPYTDSPAIQAGVQDGDILLQVDDLQVTPDTALDVLQASLRGPEGKSVSLVVRRETTDETLTLSMVREEIPLPSVTWNLVPEDRTLGIIQVNIIAATTPDEITSAAKDLLGQGASRLILDLKEQRRWIGRCRGQSGRIVFVIRFAYYRPAV